MTAASARGAFRSAPSPVSIAASVMGVSSVQAICGGQCVGLLGAVPGRPALDLRVRTALDEGLATLPDDRHADPPTLLADFAGRVDDAIRWNVGDGDSLARATFAAAFVRGDTLWLARTGHATVLLVRRGVLTVLEDPQDLATDEWRPWLGSRQPGTEREPPRVDVLPQGLVLVPGDRLLLCSLPVRSLVDAAALGRMISEGDLDAAVETLAGALCAHRAVDEVAVVMFACGDTPEGDEGVSSFDAGVLAGLSDLLHDITEELDLREASAPSEGLELISVEPREPDPQAWIPTDVPDSEVLDEDLHTPRSAEGRVNDLFSRAMSRVSGLFGALAPRRRFAP